MKSTKQSKSTSKLNVSDPESNAGIFIRKTFALVSSAPKTICSWQSDGKSFILKNKNPKPATVGCKLN